MHNIQVSSMTVNRADKKVENVKIQGKPLDLNKLTVFQSQAIMQLVEMVIGYDQKSNFR